MNGNTFKEARNIARYCTRAELRDILRSRTDECKELFDLFNISASRLDFKNLVGAWTRMLVAMDACGPYVGAPPTVGGRLSLPREEAA